MTLKRCGCGRCFTRAQWRELQYVGAQADDVETLELRNCPCGSTIAVVVEQAVVLVTE
jgi:hypothetical protein